MNSFQPAAEAADAHPRGTWFDPASRGQIPQARLLERLAGHRVLLLGETHDVAEIHRWQLHVIAALQARRPTLAVGFEMFPRATQPLLDRWVAGHLRTEEFLAAVDWFRIWGFDPELYLPLFHFCRQQRVPMLALNCPRALVSRVRREGWDAIPEAERDGLTPAAPPTAAYRRWLARLMSRLRERPVVLDRRFDGFLAAQQTWDRAFACNIARALQGEAPPELVVGIVGRGHLEHGHGTPYQLGDLGISDHAVFLTTTAEDDPERALAAGIATAVFRLDDPEPPAGRPPKLGLTVEQTEEGLRIGSLQADSPAALSGLRDGDRLLALAGRVPASAAEVWGLLRRLPAGCLLPLTVSRDGSELAVVPSVPAPAPRPSLA